MLGKRVAEADDKHDNINIVTVVFNLSFNTTIHQQVLLLMLSPQLRSPSSHLYSLFSSIANIESVTSFLPPVSFLSGVYLITLGVLELIFELEYLSRKQSKRKKMPNFILIQYIHRTFLTFFERNILLYTTNLNRLVYLL